MGVFTPDLIDRDEEATGKRKESLFFAIQKSGVKISRAIAFVAIGGALQLSGLNMELVETSTADKVTVTLLFGVGVGLCFVVCALFLKRTETLFSKQAPAKEDTNPQWVPLGLDKPALKGED